MREPDPTLRRPEFPRSNAYDADWMLENQMGPNALWLLEWLCEEVQLKPGSRVLDLGCGMAMTSIFLAKEFGVRVWAADLWMDPDPNWRRIVEAGCGDSVCPLRAEAHALPFARGFFDAAISIDAYQYFGTDELYLDYLARFVRPGGRFGVVVPALMQPIGDRVPAHLAEPQSNGTAFWEDGCRCFKTREFWEDLWGRCGKVAEARAEIQADGWKLWADFERAVERAGTGIFPSCAEAIERDAGRYLGFVRVTATRLDTPDENLYDPALGMKVRADR